MSSQSNTMDARLRTWSHTSLRERLEKEKDGIDETEEEEDNNDGDELGSGSVSMRVDDNDNKEDVADDGDDARADGEADESGEESRKSQDIDVIGIVSVVLVSSLSRLRTDLTSTIGSNNDAGGNTGGGKIREGMASLSSMSSNLFSCWRQLLASPSLRFLVPAAVVFNIKLVASRDGDWRFLDDGDTGVEHSESPRNEHADAKDSKRALVAEREVNDETTTGVNNGDTT